MKKGLFKILPLIALMGVNNVYAEYTIKIPLEPSSIIFDDAEVTGTIELKPATINRGESSSIEWNYTYADSISIEDVGTFNYTNGSIPINSLTSRSYNVEITNGDKNRNEVLNLTVIQPTQNIIFNANPTRIGVGQSTKLDWDVSNSYGVNISGIGNNLGLNGEYTISPTTSTSYTLTATGYEGVSDATETVNVEVVPDAIINQFNVDKEKVTKGESVVFSWNVANAESLSLNPFGPLVQKVSGSQSITFNTAGNFTYTLEAVSLSGVTRNSQRTISVYETPIINNFTVNGLKSINIHRNADLNFAWNTAATYGVRLNGSNVSGVSQILKSNTTLGSTTYTLQATNEAGQSTNDTVNVNTIELWNAIAATYDSWINSGTVYSCTAWSPVASTVTINQSFTQTRSCSQNQTRNKQDREQEIYTKVIRNVGAAISENQTITVTQSQTSTGTKETWVAATPTYTNWVNSGGIYGCSNWSPATSTVASGQSFTQTATDCEQNQTRTRQDRQQETTTLAYRNVGSPVTETNILYNKTNTRPATGTLVSYKYDTNHFGRCTGQQLAGQTVVTVSVMYYNGVKVYEKSATDSYVNCQLYTGFTINGYTLGAKKGTYDWEIKKN